MLPILRSFLDNYRQYLEGYVEEGDLGKDAAAHRLDIREARREAPR